MYFEVYLDFISTASFFIFTSRSHSSNDFLRTKIYIVRVIFGIIVNTASLVIICIIHKTMLPSGTPHIILYTVIIFHLMWMFMTELFVSYSICCRTVGNMMYLLLIGANYRLLDIVFDLYLVLYSIMLSDWKMTELSITIITFFCIDIFLNFALYAITLRKIKQIDELNSMNFVEMTTTTLCPWTIIFSLCCGYDMFEETFERMVTHTFA